MHITRRKVAAGIGVLVATLGLHGTALARAQPPVKIGFSIAQTGQLAGGGKGGLLALEMWRDDVNARGGLLGRKVELVAYDDQSNPANVPGIYSKLLELDKVDLLVGPYGTNLAATIMPMVKARDLLIINNLGTGVNAKIKHDKWFNNAPFGEGAAAFARGFLEPAKKIGAQTIAFLAADAEFSQNVANEARAMAKAMGMRTVYDQNYPPSTVDFSSMVRAVRAAKPDVVFLGSYPSDASAIVRAVNEIGVGDSVKMIGGGMAGPQFSALMTSLGPQLNGFVNYQLYVPEGTVDYPGLKEFLVRYAPLAEAQKIDQLGYYVPPFNYAVGQILEQAVTSTKSLNPKVLADYLHKNELKTIVGNFRYSPTGEWAVPRVLMVQYQGVVGKGVEQFRQKGKQVIIYPENLKSGELRQPFAQAQR
jgi:branched-chain amino acid transport system substrate-binding protein